MEKNENASHLFGQESAMVGTFLRIDVPVLAFIDKYVLYTDVDVFFRKDVKLSDFGRRLPRYYTVGTESHGELIKNGADQYSGNAGVMLINVPAMRQTYDDFVSFIFSKENVQRGFVFGDMGPGDQGAYNDFYQGLFEVKAWPRFNWKPYWDFREEAQIIHFHGPKPHQYAEWVRDGKSLDLFQLLFAKCDFKNPYNGCVRFNAEVSRVQTSFF